MKSSIERRRFGRRPTRAQAWIMLPGRQRLSCRVGNISEFGAFLELEPPKWLPAQFRVQLEGEATVRNCEIRHVTESGIGVEFRAASLEPGADRSEEQLAPVGTTSWFGLKCRS